MSELVSDLRMLFVRQAASKLLLDPESYKKEILKYCTLALLMDDDAHEKFCDIFQTIIALYFDEILGNYKR